MIPANSQPSRIASSGSRCQRRRVARPSRRCYASRTVRNASRTRRRELEVRLNLDPGGNLLGPNRGLGRFHVAGVGALLELRLREIGIGPGLRKRFRRVGSADRIEGGERLGNGTLGSHTCQYAHAAHQI
jgi:hypothetical protein